MTSTASQQTVPAKLTIKEPPKDIQLPHFFKGEGGEYAPSDAPVCAACGNNEPDSVRELLRLGIDTTIKTKPADPEDEPAMTALELAEGGGFEGSEEMVAILKRGW